VHACHLCYSGGGPQSRPTWAKPGDPIQKITEAKRSGGLTQVVECLANKCKVIPHTTKTKQNKELLCIFCTAHTAFTLYATLDVRFVSL
jgi:hypothetical protein